MDRWFCALGLLLLSCFATKAQDDNIQFGHLNLDQGLSQGTVYSILQDRTGFMWFATQDGLNKYDGYTFTTYRVDQEDSTSLSDNYTQDLYEDHDGHIWVATLSGGLNRFDRKSETFTVLRHRTDTDQSLSSDKVTTVTQDGDLNLWVGTADGLNRLLPNGNKFKRYIHSNLHSGSLSNNVVTAIFNDSKNRLWVGTENGLNRYLPNSDGFQHYPVPSNFISAINEDNQGNLLVGTKSGLYRLEYTLGSAMFASIDFPIIRTNEVSTLLVDPEGNIWIAYAGEGMVRWSVESDRFFHVKYDPAQPRSLSNDLVNDLYYDKFRNLWAGTLNGINKTNVSDLKFDLYQNIPGILGHTSNSIFGIHKDPTGGIWTATREGVFYLDRSGNSIQKFDNSHHGILALTNRAFRSLYQDEAGIVWLGSEHGVLEALDPLHKTVEAYVLNPNIDDNTIYTIFEDAPEHLWLGTTSGLYGINKQSGSVDYYNLERVIGKNLSSNEIRAITADSKSNLWIGTLGAGLFYFNLENKTLTQYEHDPQDPFSLSGNIAPSLYIDERDTLWVGTTSGLNKFHMGESKFYRYNEADGLPNDVVYGILNQGGHLWLSTNQGISRFNPSDGSFRNFNVSDGLQGSEFNSGAYHRGADGELFFGGINGYNGFYPSSIKDNQLLPEVVLTGFKVFNEDRSLSQSLESTDTITLSYHDSFFSFEFTGLHLVAPEKNQYAYLMEGFDRDWVHTDRRFASYTNLDPGTYTFKVKASNNDGIWNENGLAVVVNITPPFWKTWWFYFVGLILAGVIIYGLYRFRIAQVRKEEKLKTEFNKKLAEVEMTALRAQMNPHFLFNCLNSINRYIVKSDPETASGYLTKFSRLIRLILQNSKSPAVPLESELEALQLYIEMEEMRFDNQFDYKIQVGKNIEPQYVVVPPMILQPYVENAIWHGLMHKEAKGSLLIDLSLEEKWLRCVIEDNGIGRKKAQKLKSKSATRKKSMGMKITSDRLSLVNHLYNQKTKVDVIDLEDANKKPSGTRVIVHIPLIEEAWPVKDLSPN
ncbi:MAG: two-component regulator propeller domain-containing protein [Cyclobacteriaceae bacterium]